MEPSFQDSEFLIDENNLVHELTRGAHLMARVATARRSARFAASQAKLDLESTTAQLSLSIRADAELSGRKVTEGGIDASMRANPTWQIAAEQKNAADAADGYLGDLMRAAEAKAGLIQSLVKLTSSEMRA